MRSTLFSSYNVLGTNSTGGRVGGQQLDAQTIVSIYIGFDYEYIRLSGQGNLKERINLPSW